MSLKAEYCTNLVTALFHLRITVEQLFYGKRFDCYVDWIPKMTRQIWSKLKGYLERFETISHTHFMCFQQMLWANLI